MAGLKTVAVTARMTIVQTLTFLFTLETVDILLGFGCAGSADCTHGAFDVLGSSHACPISRTGSGLRGHTYLERKIP